MIISVNCTIEELEARVAAMQKALQENTIDRLYWLETLLAVEEFGTEANPYKNLPNEEANAKFDEWMAIYKNKYKEPRTKILTQILDSLLKEEADATAFNSLKPYLLQYMKNDTGGIQHKSALLIEKYSLEELVTAMLPLPENATDKDVYNTFYALNRFEFEKELPIPVIQQLAIAMQTALVREYQSSNPYFNIFNLVNKLAPLYAKPLAVVQKELVDVLDIEHLDYRGYGSAIFMIQKAWPHIQPYWTEETITTLVENMIEVIDDEFSAGDAFVEDNVLRAIKVIGKDNADAQKTIEWVEKELAEYYAQEDDDDEDDDE